MKKPTYSAIAAAAGVGTATVERVLNGRGGVRPETVEKVVLAARALDWPTRLPERHQGIIRIEVILVRPETSFFARLSKAFRSIAASLDHSVQIHVTFLSEDDPLMIADRISNPPIRRSGLVIASPGHPAVEAALSHLNRAGLPIVQVVTKTIDGADFVGIDNVAAGRMAGMMMSKLGGVQGTVVALCHSQVYQVHKERIRGFSDYLDGNPRPDLRFAHVYFASDDRDACAARISEALWTWPDLAGVYNAGGGNVGVLRELRHAGRDIFFIGHELYEVTAAALQDGIAGVIFDQLPEAQARRSIDLLFWRIGLTNDPVDNQPIRFTTITKLNI